MLCFLDPDSGSSSDKERNIGEIIKREPRRESKTIEKGLKKDGEINALNIDISRKNFS